MPDVTPVLKLEVCGLAARAITVSVSIIRENLLRVSASVNTSSRLDGYHPVRVTGREIKRVVLLRRFETLDTSATEQFKTADSRSPEEIADLVQLGPAPRIRAGMEGLGSVFNGGELKPHETT